MATVVLVHGIAQEQKSADELENVWLPALAGGVRASGNPQLADRLWRAGAVRDIDVRMAYYGDLFLDPDAQGSGHINEFDNDTAMLADQLADAWLTTAAEHAHDPRDRSTAQRELNLLIDPPADPQGARAALRPVMNTLARLRWFAPLGAGLAGKFVYRALSQVTRYLTDDTLRTDVQQRVLDLIDDDTRLVIAHSLGTVIAYESLHRSNQPAAFITLGSPLGLRTIVYDRLRPQPSAVPPCLTRWDNYAAPDDLVAAHTDLTNYFPPQPGSDIRPVSGPPLDTGSQPHDAGHYLSKKSVGSSVSHALADRQSEPT